MNTIALPVEQTPCVFAPDDTVSDDVLQTENLRRWLSHRVNSDRMYDATEGIAEAVLQ